MIWHFCESIVVMLREFYSALSIWTRQDARVYLASGMTEDEIPTDFSELIREDIQACLPFAADRERKRFTAAA